MLNVNCIHESIQFPEIWLVFWLCRHAGILIMHSGGLKQVDKFENHHQNKWGREAIIREVFISLSLSLLHSVWKLALQKNKLTYMYI